ncbi:MAG TPA: hypothetical protein ENN43_00695 [bacterium]|nr:hypothetical protein [bacterium]
MSRDPETQATVLFVIIMIITFFAGDYVMYFLPFIIGAYIFMFVFWGSSYSYGTDNRENQERGGHEYQKSWIDSENEYNSIALGKEQYCLWERKSITFYCGGSIIAIWKRDKYGNITDNKEGEAVSGGFDSFCIEGRNCFGARTYYDKNRLSDGEIYWTSGELIKALVFEDEKLTGPFMMRGKIRLNRGMLVMGRKEGVVEGYYNNGNRQSQYVYKNGLREGAFTVFHPYGKLREEGEYIGGKRCGYVKAYNADGEHINDVYYNAGRMIIETRYGLNGRVDGEYVSDEIKKIGAGTAEIREIKRLAAMKNRLAQYGLIMEDPKSDSFPRVRVIKKPGSSGCLKEFSCEEELMKWCGNKENIRKLAAKTRKKIFTEHYYGADGRPAKEIRKHGTAAGGQASNT